MAFKLALIASVFFAQGLALRLRGSTVEVCSNPSELEFPYELGQAMNEMDEVRDTVSMAALDAYARGNNVRVILACFRQQRGQYVKLGLRISKMVTEASIEMTLRLADKADRYTRLLEPPMVKIAFTVVGVIDSVYSHMKNHEYLKAAEAVLEARRIIDENAREVAKHIIDLGREMPEFAARANELARGIHKEAKDTCTALRQAFKTCVEEGGPHKPSYKEEGEESHEIKESHEVDLSQE